MTLVYRAVWDDTGHDPVALLDEEFSAWCAEKGLPRDAIPYRGDTRAADKRVEVRRGDAEFGRVLRVRLTEENEGRTWTTTATALSDGQTVTYWVDLDCVDPSRRRIPVAAPRLVRRLLQQGRRATRGPVELRLRHRVLLQESGARHLVAVLLDQRRDLPIVVFSPDEWVTVEENDKRAQAAAETLAGLASVYLLGPGAIDAFNDALPEGFRVYHGSARLYLPGLEIGDADDSVRHRYYPPQSFDRHPRRAGQLIAERLATIQPWPAPPPSWNHLRLLVERPSAEEIAARRSELSFTGEVDREDVAALRRENDELAELLVIAERERDAQRDDYESELDRLREELRRYQNEVLDGAAAQEDLVAERDSLLRNLRLLSLQHGQLTEAVEDDIDRLETPLTPSAAIDLAREHLRFVVIADDAVRDIDRLDASEKDRVWAANTWQGLKALDRYASDVAAGVDTGGFYIGCQKTASWPTSRLAMVESETVMNNADLARCRVLPVSTEVSPTGFVTMEAHLKIQPGGGMNIPRLYFYDDTKGSTGKIHVGFYGPHDLMPNTKTN